jgi:hypothetical protein
VPADIADVVVGIMRGGSDHKIPLLRLRNAREVVGHIGIDTGSYGIIGDRASA